jgi:hypothetical protein
MLKRFVLLSVLAASSSASATTILSKSVPKSWGASHFEAGYTASTVTSYTADSKTGVTGDQLGIDAKATAWVKVFGSKQNLVEVRGEGHTRVDGSRDYDVEIWGWILGSKVRLHADDWNEADGLILLEDSLDLTVYAVEKRFYGVVKVRAALKAEAGYSVAGTTTNNFIGARLTPYVRAYARFTASVDVLVAEGGAYGELNLITASLPLYANMKATSAGCYDSDVDMDAKVTKLDGEAGVFYRLLWSDPKDQEIWSWNGVESTTVLHDAPTVTGCL